MLRTSMRYTNALETGGLLRYLVTMFNYPAITSATGNTSSSEAPNTRQIRFLITYFFGAKPIRALWIRLVETLASSASFATPSGWLCSTQKSINCRFTDLSMARKVTYRYQIASIKSQSVYRNLGSSAVEWRYDG